MNIKKQQKNKQMQKQDERKGSNLRPIRPEHFRYKSCQLYNMNIQVVVYSDYVKQLSLSMYIMYIEQNIGQCMNSLLS